MVQLGHKYKLKINEVEGSFYVESMRLYNSDGVIRVSGRFYPNDSDEGVALDLPNLFLEEAVLA